MSRIQSFADQIAQAGVARAFGVLGSGASLELVDALEKHGVAFHAAHHEASAAIMAGTVGRLSGIPGVAIGIKGPGFANMASGLSACLLDGLPMIAAVEAYPPDTDWTVRHKGMDHASLARAIAKARVQLTVDGGFGGAAAFAHAEAQGPVVVELTDGEAVFPDPPPPMPTTPTWSRPSKARVDPW